MIDRRIVGFLARRGTNSERARVLFEPGELVYTTDTKRVYIGDGSTVGGIPVSNKNSVLTEFPTTYAMGDFVYRSDLLRTYVATEAGFTFIGPYPDERSIDFSDNKLRVANAGITFSKLNPDVASLTGGIILTSTGLSINYDPYTLGISPLNQLYVQPNAVIDSINTGNVTFIVNNLVLTNATLRTFTEPATAKAAYLLMSVNGLMRGIQLWDLPAT